MTRLVCVLAAVAALAANACDARHTGSPADAAPASRPPVAASTAPSPVGDRAAALAVFAARCAACHGPQGLGDGAAAASLDPKPRDFHSHAWQVSVTDDHIEQIIREGGPAVGKSPLMPANKDLASQPEVVLGLRTLVREFGPP